MFRSKWDEKIAGHSLFLFCRRKLLGPKCWLGSYLDEVRCSSLLSPWPEVKFANFGQKTRISTQNSETSLYISLILSM